MRPASRLMIEARPSNTRDTASCAIAIVSSKPWPRILDDLQSAGVPIVDVSGGEATLRDDWLDVVRAARRRGFAVRLFTNGYTMTAAIATELKAIGVLGVDVSVYSDDPAQHDFITR